MTNAEQNAYWRKWSRFQQKYEKAFIPKFTKALQIQVKAYIKTQDIMSIPSFPIYDVLVKLYKSCGPEWAKFAFTQGTKADGQMGFNEQIVALMKEYFGIDLLNDAELMTQYSREVISRVLSNSLTEGWSIQQIVNELLKSPEFNAMRARRIARTETVTAANGAAIIYAQQSGAKMSKIWIAVKDKRTRHDHSVVDGTIIPIDKPFNLHNDKLGLIQMMQPGARTQANGLPTPASEVVNCRCTVAFKAMRGADGRIIRA
jgi:hypothetical protein